MTNNLLGNSSFEADWGDEESHRCLVFPGGEERDVDNIHTPPGWVTWFRHEPGTWDQPEVHDAWAEIDPARVHDGQKGILLFTFFRKHDAGFLQQVQVEPGMRLRLSAYAHAWSNTNFDHEDDPRWSEGAGYDIVAWLEGSQPPDGTQQQDAKSNFTFWVGIDSTGGTDPYADSVAWSEGWHIYNGYCQQLTVEAVAEAGTVTVFLRSRTLWPFKHNDAYWDSVELVAVPDEERGQPRVQYERTYVLLPPAVGAEWVKAVADGAWDKHRYTIGGSADDAGIGDLDERNIIAVNPEYWPGDLPAFFEEHYPGVQYTPVTADSPTALIAALKALDNGGNGNGNGNGDELPPPEPRKTRGHIGLHFQNNCAGMAEFFEQVQPSVIKFVGGFERAIPLLAASPHTSGVQRNYSGNNYGGILDADDPHVGAKRWLAQFKDTAIALAGQTDEILYWECINEVMPSLNEAAVRRAVNLDMAFIDVVMDLGIDNIRPAVFCVAVGNPHESEYPLLVPLARKCAQARGLMGYHNYWLSNPDYGGPDHLWPYLAGRWTEMDKVFVAADPPVYVDWYGGESGAVGGRSSDGEAGNREADSMLAWILERGMDVGRAQFRTDDDRVYGIAIGDGSPRSLERGDWVALYPYDGWKSPECLDGNWSRYLAEIARMDELTAKWNAANGDRFVGSVLFTTSGPGWDSFDIGTAQIAAIGAMLRERYQLGAST